MENKHTIYFNMCHHYRKIFNAKSTVDTSPPKAFQMKNTQWKFRNTSPFRQKTPIQDIKTFNKEPYFIQDNGTIMCKYYYQHHKKKEEPKIDKSFTIPSKPFNPVILHTNVSSKLRNLRVYHPPRRKKVGLRDKETSQPSPNNGDGHKEEILPHTVFEKSTAKNVKRSSFPDMDRNSYSEESSEDSAYNEGEGVLSGDSRGSTPQNISNKHQNTKLLESTPIAKNTMVSSTKKSDEIIYIQFLKDITNDILKKNIFTNKALKCVFHHHVQLNKYNLDSEKMLKEISKLQDRLGVPKDDKLDDENYGLGKDISSSDEKLFDTPSSTENQLEPSKFEETFNQEEDNVIKENDYSDDFSDYENNSSNSGSNRNNSDNYDTSEENDQLSSISDDNLDNQEVESVLGDENINSTNEDTESVISEIC